MSAEHVPEPETQTGSSFEMKPGLNKSASEDNPLIKPHVVTVVSPNEETCPDPILEMDLLAKMVYQNFDTAASVILPHVVVKTFLDLKWKKLRVPIYLLTLFYASLAHEILRIDNKILKHFAANKKDYYAFLFTQIHDYFR